MNRLAISLSFLLIACGSSTAPVQSQSGNATPQPDAGIAAPVAHSAAPIASASPTPAPKPAPMKQAEKLALKRLVLAHGIDKREPQDVSTTFNAKESKIYAFVEVENPEKLPGEWTAIVKDAKGHELGRQTFNVEL